MSLAETFGNLPCTDDAFMGGMLSLLQPKRGFRAGADSILLAGAVSAGSGGTVLDVGSGVGAIGLAVARRLPEVSVVCLEIQQALSALAGENAVRNGLDERSQIVCGDLAKPPLAVKERTFDSVVSNPPYYETSRSRPSSGASRTLARRESHVPLPEWIDFCLRRTKPGGTTTLIHLTARLDEVLVRLQPRAGGIVIFPLWPQPGKEAKRVIVQSTKGSVAPLRIASGLVLHDEDGNYTARADAVLRHGAALDLNEI